MVHFANPALLFLGLAVPPLIWWWLRRPRAAIAYSDTRILASLPAGNGRFVRWAGIAIRAAALLLLVIALAGPRWPDPGSRISTEGIAIEMLVDVSGSMAEHDFNWDGRPISRLDAAKQAFQLFVKGGEGPGGARLEGRPDDQIGVVTFATWPENLCPLTLSHAALLQALDAARPASLPTEQTTNIGDAVAWGLHRLESGHSRKIMVLLSDGEHNEGPPALKPRQAAQLAANMHVPIYTIDAGGDPAGKEGPIAAEAAAGTPETREAGEKTLQSVAQITGGRYFRAHDGPGLVAVCQEIDRLERKEIQSFQYRRYYEGFAWFGLVSFVLWLGIQTLERTVWLRLP